MIVITQYADGFEVTSSLNLGHSIEVVSSGLITEAKKDELVKRAKDMNNGVMLIDWIKDTTFEEASKWEDLFTL